MPRRTDDVARKVWSNVARETMRELAHWRHTGRWADDATWLAIGRRTLAHLRKTLRAFFPDLARPFDAWKPGDPALFSGAALEWGPGGGSNVLALAPLFTRYYGVDISAPTLAEAKRQADEARIGTFVPVHLQGPPESVAAEIDAPIELAVSTAVFQHFPGKDYGRRVLRILREVMVPGALGLVQIRYDDGDPDYRSREGEDYESCFVTYTSYRLDEFCRLLRAEGFDLLECTIENPHINYAMFAFRRPLD